MKILPNRRGYSDGTQARHVMPGHSPRSVQYQSHPLTYIYLPATNVFFKSGVLTKRHRGAVCSRELSARFTGVYAPVLFRRETSEEATARRLANHLFSPLKSQAIQKRADTGSGKHDILACMYLHGCAGEKPADRSAHVLRSMYVAGT